MGDVARMPGIPGKLRTEDLPQLVELICGKTVLQLGCWCGRGLVALAPQAAKVWVLESFRYPDGLECVLEELKTNVDRYVPEDRPVNLLRGDAEGWTVPPGSEDLPAEGVEVIYRDADRNVLEHPTDEALAFALLSRCGGVYAWHDEEHRLRWLKVEPVPVEVN